MADRGHDDARWRHTLRAALVAAACAVAVTAAGAAEAIPPDSLTPTTVAPSTTVDGSLDASTDVGTPASMPDTTLVPAVDAPPTSATPPEVSTGGISGPAAVATSPTPPSPTASTGGISGPAAVATIPITSESPATVSEPAPTGGHARQGTDDTSSSPSSRQPSLPATGAPTNVMLLLGATGLLGGTSLVALSRRPDGD